MNEIHDVGGGALRGQLGVFMLLRFHGVGALNLERKRGILLRWSIAGRFALQRLHLSLKT